MSTTDRNAPAGSPYVTRDVCEAFREEQRGAHARTWQEIRTLRRLVILLIVGGQLFSGGLNVAGVTYWLDQHAARPHASTVEMVAAVRQETRRDLNDLRRQVQDLLLAVVRQSRDPAPHAGPREGDME